jgi:hypothetical protein
VPVEDLGSCGGAAGEAFGCARRAASRVWSRAGVGELVQNWREWAGETIRSGKTGRYFILLNSASEHGFSLETCGEGGR